MFQEKLNAGQNRIKGKTHKTGHKIKQKRENKMVKLNDTLHVVFTTKTTYIVIIDWLVVEPFLKYFYTSFYYPFTCLKG